MNVQMYCEAVTRVRAPIVCLDALHLSASNAYSYICLYNSRMARRVLQQFFFDILGIFWRFLAPVRTNLAVLQEVSPNPNLLPDPDFMSELFRSLTQQTSPPIFGGPPYSNTHLRVGAPLRMHMAIEPNTSVTMQSTYFNLFSHQPNLRGSPAVNDTSTYISWGHNL